MNMDLKPYPEYKDSGVEWLGRVPEHWTTEKVKFLFKDRVQKGFENEPLLAATQTKGVIPKKLYDNRTVLPQKDLHLLKLVKKGDFVISLRSFQGGIEYAYYQGIISPAYTIMNPRQQIFSDYFKYLFKSKGFIKNLTLFVTGIRQGQNIDYFKFKNSFLPLPAYNEQKLIATFLNRKTNLINRFFKGKKRLIELLEEQKKAIINEAVTGKIDLRNWKPGMPDSELKPYPKYKDSGVEWLGRVPEHWSVEHNRGLFSERNIKNRINEELLSVTIKKGIIRQSELIANTSKKDSSNQDKSKYKLVMTGDIVYNKMRLWQGAVGISIYQGIVSHAYIVIIPKNKANSWYYHYLFRTPSFTKESYRYSYGICDDQLSLRYKDFKVISSPVPPIVEQEKIVSFIKGMNSKINRFIKGKKRLIELLEEQKKAIINDAVTGKIDVRNIDLSKFEDAEEFQDIDEMEEEGLSEEIEDIEEEIAEAKEVEQKNDFG